MTGAGGVIGGVHVYESPAFSKSISIGTKAKPGLAQIFIPVVDCDPSLIVVTEQHLKLFSHP